MVLESWSKREKNYETLLLSRNFIDAAPASYTYYPYNQLSYVPLFLSWETDTLTLTTKLF